MKYIGENALSHISKLIKSIVPGVATKKQPGLVKSAEEVNGSNVIVNDDGTMEVKRLAGTVYYSAGSSPAVVATIEVPKERESYYFMFYITLRYVGYMPNTSGILEVKAGMSGSWEYEFDMRWVPLRSDPGGLFPDNMFACEYTDGKTNIYLEFEDLVGSDVCGEVQLISDPSIGCQVKLYQNLNQDNVNSFFARSTLGGSNRPLILSGTIYATTTSSGGDGGILDPDVPPEPDGKCEAKKSINEIFIEAGIKDTRYNFDRLTVVVLAANLIEYNPTFMFDLSRKTIIADGMIHIIDPYMNDSSAYSVTIMAYAQDYDYEDKWVIA